MESASNNIELLSPADGAIVSLKTPEQLAFFKDSARFVPHEADPTPNKLDNTAPFPVRFKWKPMIPAVLLLSENPEMTDVCEYRGSGDLRVFNLKVNTRYYYELKNARYSSGVRSFVTADELPRCINMPDVTNVRDCGGWPLADGGRYKQAMLYRGGEFEPWTVLGHGCGINAEGEKVWRNLQIKTELDLRHDGNPYFKNNESIYCKIPSTAYATWQEEGIFAADAKEQMRKIFELLADENVYPLYFHCQGGGDRTGTLAFLLGALLGMSYEDLLTDYEFSNLSVSGERIRSSTVWKAFEARLQSYSPNGTWQERSINYLLDCGITCDILQKIKSILTER